MSEQISNTSASLNLILISISPHNFMDIFQIVLPVHFKLIMLAILCTTLPPWQDSSYLFLYFQAMEKGVGSRSSGVYS